MPTTSVDTPQGSMRRLASAVGAGCLLIALAAPIWIVWRWAVATPESLVISHLSPIDAQLLGPNGQIVEWKRVVGGAFSLIPVVIMSWGWLRARAALLAIGADRVFAPVVVHGLKGYAAASFWSAVASFLLHPAMSVALTLDKPSGQHTMSVSVSSEQVIGIVGAGVVWIIVAALARGAQAADENRQFV